MDSTLARHLRFCAGQFAVVLALSFTLAAILDADPLPILSHLALWILTMDAIAALILTVTAAIRRPRPATKEDV